MMQAAIISAHKVSYAVIRDSSHKYKASSLMGYVAMAWTIAPLMALVFGRTVHGLNQGNHRGFRFGRSLATIKHFQAHQMVQHQLVSDKMSSG